MMKRFILTVMMAALSLVVCAGTHGDPTDKMAELGLTPDGQMLPPKVEFVVPTTAQYVLPVYDRLSGEYTTMKVDVPPAKANASADGASKVHVLMEMLLRADPAILSGGMTYDDTVRGAADDAVVVRFTLPAPMTNYAAFATGDGVGLGGLISDVVIGNLGGDPVRSVGVEFRKNAQSEYVSVDDLAPELYGGVVEDGPEMFDEPLSAASTAPTKATASNLLQSGPRPTGVLTGKAVYFNPGHGKVWRGTGNQSFSYQRGFVHNNQEDFSNSDFINQFAMPYIWASGGDTFSARETDPSPHMVVVDNDDAATGNQYGFSKTGTWIASSMAGYRNGRAPYLTAVNPHAQGTINLATCVTGPTPTATATWAAQILVSGYYNVYVTHGAFTNRATAAQYKVYHAGGVTDCPLNQKRWPNTWVQLGRFYFEKDAQATNAKVVLTNISGSTADYISIDAVRWGGGTGLISRGTAGTSGEPRVNEDARYHLQYMGVPDLGTYGYNASSDTEGSYPETHLQCDEADGWTARPRFAKWLKYYSEVNNAGAQDSCMISNHTNATSNGTGRGFQTYRSSTTGNDNVAYQAVLHPVIANMLRGVFSASPGPIYNGYGLLSGAYGEANPGSAGMPVVLGEWLFHDNALDMQLYHHPRFKQMLARGIQHGIIDYWKSKGTITTAVYSPEPITTLCVLQESATTVRLTWSPPPTTHNGYTVASAATGYRIWQSEHGRAFPNAIATMTAPASGAPTYLVTGLTPGKTYYFRVSATNAGGESVGGDTLAVRTETASTAKKILIVQGFNKLDPSTRINWSYSGGTMYRSLLDRLNTYDYIYEHCKGIDAYCAQYSMPVKVDSCNKTSIEGQWVLLGGYDAVIWMSGLESEVCAWDCWNDTSIGTNSRARITAYLNTVGKALFISGSEVAWEMATAGKNVDNTFLTGTLKANYVSDSNGGIYAAKSLVGGIFEGLDGAIAFDNGTDWQRVGYQVAYPDVLGTTGGSTAALGYGSDTIDSFDTLGSWQAPSYSGSTTVASGARALSTSVKVQGSASLKIDCTWGSNSTPTLREYNSAQPTFTLATGDTISYWVYGDNSNSTIRFVFRDSDNELWYHNAISINWTGWRQFSYKRGTDTFTKYAGTGDNVITGTAMKIDSFLWVKGAATTASNTIYIDDLCLKSATPGATSIAAVQYGTPSTSRIVFMGFPLESVVDDTVRNTMMTRIVNFLLPQTTGVGSVQVTIAPAAAITAGAQWRVNGGAWQTSSATVANVPAGTATVEYSDISATNPKLIKPANITVTVSNGATASATGTYTYPATVGEWDEE